MAPGRSNKRRNFSGDKVTNDMDVRDLIGRCLPAGQANQFQPHCAR